MRYSCSQLLLNQLIGAVKTDEERIECALVAVRVDNHEISKPLSRSQSETIDDVT